MKHLTPRIAVAVALLATAASAEKTVIIDGQEYALSAIMENCQSMADEPEAQIACFAAISKLIENQEAANEVADVDFDQLLQDVQVAANYRDDNSGLSVSGSACTMQIVSYGNYFYLSRRNVSSIDLFAVEFDANAIELTQSGAGAMFSGRMNAGTYATARGGPALDSAELGFEAKSARISLDAYAFEVLAQLPVRKSQTVEAMLVHPHNQQASAEIWSAFTAYVDACTTHPSMQNSS